jgi:hypothetical protein
MVFKPPEIYNPPPEPQDTDAGDSQLGGIFACRKNLSAEATGILSNPKPGHKQDRRTPTEDKSRVKEHNGKDDADQLLGECSIAGAGHGHSTLRDKEKDADRVRSDKPKGQDHSERRAYWTARLHEIVGRLRSRIANGDPGVASLTGPLSNLIARAQAYGNPEVQELENVRADTQDALAKKRSKFTV